MGVFALYTKNIYLLFFVNYSKIVEEAFRLNNIKKIKSVGTRLIAVRHIIHTHFSFLRAHNLRRVFII